MKRRGPGRLPADCRSPIIADKFEDPILQRELQPYRLESLEGSPDGLATGYFEPLIACATAERLVFRVEPDTLHVQLKPGISAQYTPRQSGYSVVITVDDGSAGGDREGHFAAAKRKSELLFTCARGPEALPPEPPAQ